MSTIRPLRLATAGGVGHGKSTLIGRLLRDLSLVTKEREAERGAAAAIEVAYRYFATAKRRFIIADSPGHEQYAHNLASGTANADAMVLVVDVARGLAPATRRHLEVARLFGIRQIFAFVNKMDLVGYARAALESLDLDGIEAIPGSAIRGDMVVERGQALDWYKGPTLLERLESFRAGAEQAAAGPLRFPVQLVSRPLAGQPRGYVGRVESGRVLAGARVRVLPAGAQTVVRKILAHGAERDVAVAGDTVSLVLADEIGVARGDLIADAAQPPRQASALDVTLMWLGREPLRGGGRYVVRHAARRTLATVNCDGPLGANDIGQARLALDAPLYVDSYDAVRVTGALTLIDKATDQAVGAGLVR
ncbi:MAG TPA: GTP-binding protein [Burkholderiales bacterium]|jgi:sulfate adenylyltransferase subunit 1 (EFTu-like GTPase family)